MHKINQLNGLGYSMPKSGTEPYLHYTTMF